MKLVFFDDLPEGGAKRVVFEQVKRLKPKHEVIYITNTLPTQFPFEKYAARVHRFDMDLVEGRSWKRPIQELSYYFKILPALKHIAAFIERIKPDAVVVHPSRLTQASPILQYLKQPTLYFAEEWLRLVYEPELHPMPPSGLNIFYESNRRKWLSKLDGEAVEAADRIVCTSAYTKQAITAAYHREAEVVPLGVDSTLFCPKDKPLVGSYFLFIGEKEQINGYPLLQETKKVAGKNYPVKYVGFKKSKAFAYSDTQLAQLYRGAYATLCLAVNEPFGLVALESMACGVPVIAVDEAGYQDTIINKRTGLLIKRDPQQLARAMNLLQHNARLRSRLGENGRKRARRYFNWDLHVRRLEKILWSMKQ